MVMKMNVDKNVARPDGTQVQRIMVGENLVIHVVNIGPTMIIGRTIIGMTTIIGM